MPRTSRVLAQRPHQRHGKRRRRAVVRLRHAMAREKFMRWAFQTNNLPPIWLRPFWRSVEWHTWRCGTP